MGVCGWGEGVGGRPGLHEERGAEDSGDSGEREGRGGSESWDGVGQGKAGSLLSGYATSHRR